MQAKVRKAYKVAGKDYVDNFSLTKRVVEYKTIRAAKLGGVNPYTTGMVSLFGTDVPAHAKNILSQFPGLNIRVAENNKVRYTEMKEYSDFYPTVSFHYVDVFKQPVSSLADLDFEGTAKLLYPDTLKYINEQKLLPGNKCLIFTTCCRPYSREEELALHLKLCRAVGVDASYDPDRWEKLKLPDPGAYLKKLIIPFISGNKCVSLDVYSYGRANPTRRPGGVAHMLTLCLVYKP